MKLARIFSILAIAVLAIGVLGSQTASAQKPWTLKGATAPETSTGATDLLKVNYFSNANTAGAPDGTVRISNPGSGAGNLCAQIYVFDPYQEMSECCACEVTPDGLRTLSVNSDLTANPLTGVTLQTGSVSIVSGIVPANGVCNPLNNLVYPTIRAWGTHIQNSTFAITETEYSDRALGNYNFNLLLECYAIALDGSGHGTCSCGSGD
ncbi:MAG TPA: hypothetical protein VJ999_02980 [Candidatus Sulfotelmatobacter sp.]|nr:hypothetical protein [Candidatus Sulfotelmatobacter sp.]